MITHRMSTHQAPEPPVQFYKIIALSFLFITVLLLGVIVLVTSKRATITVVAKEDTEVVAVPVTVTAKPQGKGEVAGKVATTVFSWSEQYQPTGEKKVVGVATGEVILTNNTAVNQPLVKTTRLLSLSGVLLHLQEGVVVPAHGTVFAKVYADKAGVESEIGPSKFTIPGLSEAKQKVIFGESKEFLKGGLQTLGILSEADISQAKSSYAEQVKEKYLAAHPLENSGQLVFVKPEGLSVDKKIGDEISQFTISGTSTVVIVNYDSEALLALTNGEVSGRIDPALEKFLAIDKKPEISLATYSVAVGTADLIVKQNVVVTLDANVPKLSPENFVGKKKNEIERYVLGLDHVANVSVEFSPGWIMSAPSVPDKIRVVVKNVR